LNNKTVSNITFEKRSKISFGNARQFHTQRMVLMRKGRMHHCSARKAKGARDFRENPKPWFPLFLSFRLAWRASQRKAGMVQHRGYQGSTSIESM
jgi:hypothetical protein